MIGFCFSQSFAHLTRYKVPNGHSHEVESDTQLAKVTASPTFPTLSIDPANLLVVVL